MPRGYHHIDKAMLSWAANLLLGRIGDVPARRALPGRALTTLPAVRLGDFGDDGADDSEAFLEEFKEAQPQRLVKVVAGRDRSLVRAALHPTMPLRKTAAEKVLFIEWLTSESVIPEAADQFDCGCGLYEEGCYNRLVVTLMARKKKLSELLEVAARSLQCTVG